jgi:hypothetical protein
MKDRHESARRHAEDGIARLTHYMDKGGKWTHRHQTMLDSFYDTLDAAVRHTNPIGFRMEEPHNAAKRHHRHRSDARNHVDAIHDAMDAISDVLPGIPPYADEPQDDYIDGDEMRRGRSRRTGRYVHRAEHHDDIHDTVTNAVHDAMKHHRHTTTAYPHGAHPHHAAAPHGEARETRETSASGMRR